MRKQWQASAKYPFNTTNCSLYREKNHKIVYSISVGEVRYLDEKEVEEGVSNLNGKYGAELFRKWRIKYAELKHSILCSK
jgi:hypothetical protein